MASPTSPAIELPLLPPARQIDLDDVLDSSFLQPSTSYRSNTSDLDADDDIDVTDQSPSDSAAVPGRAFNDLTRWSRIPIGAYRRSTTNNSSLVTSASPALRRMGAAEGSFYVPRATTRSKSGRGKNSIPVSPVLLPSRSSAHSRTSGLLPIASKGRKSKRKPKKTPSRAKQKVAKTSPPQKGRVTPRALAALQRDQSPSSYHVQPPPPPSDDFLYSNPHLPDLPSASLPSAGCPPFSSPLFSGVGHSESIPSFSFDG
jgi:hypothetical protein